MEGADGLPNLTRSAQVLLAELTSLGSRGIIEPHHVSALMKYACLDFSDQLYLILAELRVKGYLERFADGYRIVSSAPAREWNEDGGIAQTPGRPAVGSTFFLPC